jgi:hypothetical protein
MPIEGPNLAAVDAQTFHFENGVPVTVFVANDEREPSTVSAGKKSEETICVTPVTPIVPEISG